MRLVVMICQLLAWRNDLQALGPDSVSVFLTVALLLYAARVLFATSWKADIRGLTGLLSFQVEAL